MYIQLFSQGPYIIFHIYIFSITPDDIWQSKVKIDDVEDNDFITKFFPRKLTFHRLKLLDISLYRYKLFVGQQTLGDIFYVTDTKLFLVCYIHKPLLK